MCRNVVPDRRCGIQNYTLSFQRISVQLSWKCRRWHWPLDLPPPSPFLPPDYETWNLDQPPLVKTAALVHYTGYAVRCWSKSWPETYQRIAALLHRQNKLENPPPPSAGSRSEGNLPLNWTASAVCGYNCKYCNNCIL